VSFAFGPPSFSISTDWGSCFAPLFGPPSLAFRVLFLDAGARGSWCWTADARVAAQAIAAITANAPAVRNNSWISMDSESWGACAGLSLRAERFGAFGLCQRCSNSDDVVYMDVPGDLNRGILKHQQQPCREDEITSSLTRRQCFYAVSPRLAWWASPASKFPSKIQARSG
jgi:hypothetical protein